MRILAKNTNSDVKAIRTMLTGPYSGANMKDAVNADNVPIAHSQVCGAKYDEYPSESLITLNPRCGTVISRDTRNAERYLEAESIGAPLPNQIVTAG